MNSKQPAYNQPKQATTESSPNIQIGKKKSVVGSFSAAGLTVGAIGVQLFNRLFSKHSFASVKKNVFKFGLEMILLLFVGLNILLTNFSASQSILSAGNLYLAYLEQHPDLNQAFVDHVKTERISIAPNEENFIVAAAAATIDPLTSQGAAPLVDDNGNKLKNDPPLLVSGDGTIIKPNFATKDATLKRDIQQYEVQNGDSISKIAGSFGVSLQTVMYENKLTENDYIRPGQILNILPTTGIKHTIQKGETLASIAKKYQVDIETILEFNEIEVPDDIDIGEVLIIPNAQTQIPAAKRTQIAQYNTRDVKQVNVPADFAGGSDFIWPLQTRNVTQYFSSRHKALDISNGQRPQFWASADGLVELSGWDGAYGRSVVVNHGNGLKTRYAHASELYVSAGDKVTQGQVIGRVGNTGRVYGATGLHLHFEIIKNGTKLNPVQYAKK